MDVTAHLTIALTATATATSDDPWQDEPIPDPEVGGSVTPPDLPEPEDPPNDDW